MEAGESFIPVCCHASGVSDHVVDLRQGRGADEVLTDWLASCVPHRCDRWSDVMKATLEEKQEGHSN